MTYWKVLSMVYARTTAGWMSEAQLYDVRNVGPCSTLGCLAFG
jgi:hypothetical protein